MILKRLTVFAAAGVMAAAAAVPAVAGQSSGYRIIDLGVCSDGGDSIGADVNNAGQVAGWCYGGVSFTWKGGKKTVLPGLGGYYSRTHAINDRGVIAGEASNAAGQAHAVLWRNGKIQDLGTLPGGTDSYANDINNAGEVVGFSTTVGQALHAFRWRDGRMTDLGSLPGQNYSIGNGVNNRGTVVGYATVDGMNLTPVQWQKGKISDLGRPFGDYPQGVATAVNDRGQIAGYGIGGAGNSAFLYDRGRFTNVGADVAAKLGGSYTQAEAVNVRAQVVGIGEQAAFLWDAGKVVKLAGAGSEARGINDAGTVVGDIRVDGPPGPGMIHAALWVRR